MADESGEIKEGHLCPICTIDLGSIPKLHAHFQEEHSDDINIKKFLKGKYNLEILFIYDLPIKLCFIFIGMVFQAKKIMKQSSEPDDSNRQRRKDIIYSLDIYNKPQSLGNSFSYLLSCPNCFILNHDVICRNY